MFGLTAFSYNSFSQIKVDSNGKVTLNNDYWTGGISSSVVSYGSWTIPSFYPESGNSGGLGTASNYFHTAYIHHIYSTGVLTWPSDERAKENVRDLDWGLNIVKALRPVKFDIKESFFERLDQKAKTEYRKTSKNRIGFIAQEVMQVLPNLVKQEPETGYSGIETTDLIPVLVKAIQEQQILIGNLQKELDEQKIQIQYFEQECCNPKEKSATITNSQENILLDKARLDQNNPNPFSGKTKISCFVPLNTKLANIHIFNMNGVQLKQYIISGRGEQQLTINGNWLKPGMYLYALVIDGKEIDTKRMILTK